MKLLLVEDDEEDYLIVHEILTKTRGNRFALVWAPTFEAGLEQVAQDAFAAILVDYSLLIVTLFHAASNTVGPFAGAEQTWIVGLGAVIPILVFGPAQLCRTSMRQAQTDTPIVEKLPVF